MKKNIFYLLLLISYFSFSQNTKCPLVSLAEDIVGSTDEFKEVIKTGDGFNAWKDLLTIGKKIKSIPQGHDLRFDARFLKRYSSLSETKRANLREVLDKQKAFPDQKGKVKYTGNRNIDIGDGVTRNYDIVYDEFGYPKFELHCPDGFNVTGEQLAQGNHFKAGKLDLDGLGDDMAAANKWALKKFGPEKFRSLSGGNCEIKINDNWITHTWHHHQDGKTIFPVPSGIHNTSSTFNGVSNKGFPHSGGASVIKANLRGFFPSPKF